MPRRSSPATTVLFGAMLALVGGLAVNTATVKAVWWTIATWVATGLLVVVAVIYEIAHSREALGGAVSPVELDRAADRLAQAAFNQLSREEERRKVVDPIALPIRWHAADTDIVDHDANICQVSSESTVIPLALAGRLDQITEVYKQVPSGRLVILGRGGAGKTVLAARLALDELATRPAGGRVPVLVGLGAWDPATVPLRDWLVNQVVRDYPGLAAHASSGSTLAVALLEAGRILPVLDGFDEINPGLHEAALRQLNTATKLHLVLTSRPEQYTAAVRTVDVLTHAAVIELDDLTTDDLANYLPRTTRRRTLNEQVGLWQPVLDRIQCCPQDHASAVLSQVLTTPLMVFLARTIYSDTPTGDPVELLDSTRFATAEALEEHLLAAYLPAVYLDSSPAVRSWKPDSIHRWLAYLARHLEQSATHELAWWQLRDTVPRITRSLAIGLVVSGAVGLAAGPVGDLVTRLANELVPGAVGALDNALMTGLVVGLTYGIIAGFARLGPVPARVRFQIGPPQFMSGLVCGFVSGLACGLGPGLAYGLASGVAYGVAYGLMVATVVVLPSGIASLRSVRARDRRVAGHFRLRIALTLGFAGGIGYGFVSMLENGFLYALPGALQIGLSLGFVANLVIGFEAPVDKMMTQSAAGSLITDRSTCLRRVVAIGLLLGLVVGLATGITAWLRDGAGLVAAYGGGVGGGIGVGLPVGLASGLAVGLTGAWGQWLVLVRIWLPLTGHLPWRTWSFLADACRRGVLRQYGVTFQFRHAQLQNHLARLPGPRVACAQRQTVRSSHASVAEVGAWPRPRRRDSDRSVTR